MTKISMISCLAVAMLLISLASLSSASCPWFLRGELYSAQCGVIKEVPANAGILANDPQAVAVLNPELITIDPKYGSIKVYANGSFIYNPSPNIPQGTYVQFKYNATNGNCQANYPATAKFQIRCKCRSNIVSIDSIPLPVTLEEIKYILREAGIGCIGCGDITTSIDLSDIDLDSNGMPIAGTYSFCIKCPGCQKACGQITLEDGCTCEVENFAFCEGTVTMDDLKALAEENALCTGCDSVPVLDFSEVIVDEEGYVSGGSYTGACGDDLYGASDIGYITVWPGCDVIAPAVKICAGSDRAKLESAIAAAEPGCTGEGCDASAILSYDDVLYDGDGYVIGGTYTVTCTTGKGCQSSAKGAINVVERCSCELIGLTAGCESPQDLEELIREVNSNPCVDCDATPVYHFPDWPTYNGLLVPGTYQYTVVCSGAGGLEGCDSVCTGEVIVTCQLLCTCEVEDFAFCEGTVTMDELKALAEENALCTGCDSVPVLDFSEVIVDEEGYVSGGSYTGACGDDLYGASDIGYITVWPGCDAMAPAVKICAGSDRAKLESAIAAAEPGCTGAGCDASAILSYDDVLYDGDGYVIGGTYTVTCTTSKGCQSSAKGAINVVERCSCELIGLTAGCESPPDLEELIREMNPSPCVDCDATPAYHFPEWPVDKGLVLPGLYEYTVYCQGAGDLEGCDSVCTGEVIIECQPVCSCEAVAPDIPICPNEVTLDELVNMIYGVAECRSIPGLSGSCDIMPQIDTSGVIVKDGYVVPDYSFYKVTCCEDNGCDAVAATGRVIMGTDCDECECMACAPDICLPIVCANGKCRDYSSDYYIPYVISAIKCKNGGCSGDCTVIAVIIPGNIKWDEPSQFEYTIVWGNGGCTKSAKGIFTLDWNCGCGPCGCTSPC